MQGIGILREYLFRVVTKQLIVQILGYIKTLSIPLKGGLLFANRLFTLKGERGEGLYCLPQ